MIDFYFVNLFIKKIHSEGNGLAYKERKEKMICFKKKPLIIFL